ncbi:unnamed protein product [Rodentolepis nana]|uniref:Coiled-coil domain-containing protein n=1 Tax=Rodentolepis nana TaxID=102285 RepID=A0A0R3T221_RODNA|nr:unnamed protein product [Rodentolepis nana]
MPADLNFGKRSKVKSWKNNLANQKSDKSEILFTKLENITNSSFSNQKDLPEDELVDSQDPYHIEKLKYPDTCAKLIDRLHALLRASARELHTIRIENSELRQLLTTLKKANALLQEQMSKGGFRSPNTNLDYVTLQNENERLSSELEISRGKLNTMSTAWDDCYKRLLSENNKLRKTIDDLQETIKILQQKDKPKAICDIPACDDLTQWIEKALKSALEENVERVRKLSGGSRMSLDLESTSSPPLAPPPFVTRRYSYTNSHQYTKHPVNGRSKSRKINLRLQTLTKTMETLNNPCPNKTRIVSPLETLLLMVNEILEKLTEGRMEEYIHNKRRKSLQDRNSRPIQIVMTTTTA